LVLVAVGVVFPSGKVVVEWLGPHSTFGIYNNLTDVERIHGHSGKTRVVFVMQDYQTPMNAASAEFCSHETSGTRMPFSSRTPRADNR
jgi:hypothetical protein